jgi:hypothetical protein
MSFSMGGTITLNGKTYNLSLISAVYTERILQANSGTFLLNALLFLCALFCVILVLFYVGVGGGITFLNIFMLFIGGWGCLFYFLQMGTINTTNEYSLIFEIGGKKEVVFSGNVVEVENIKNDIIIGIEKGYFPNYLQGR